jgi:hypothetical protein
MDEHNLTKVAAVFMVDVELKMIKKQGFLNFRQALFIFVWLFSTPKNQSDCLFLVRSVINYV